MSWDASLYCNACGHCIGDWNFTHNTSVMIYSVLAEASYELPASTLECWGLPRDADGKLTHYPDGHGTVAWWEHLDGMTGPEGAAYLDLIVTRLEANPVRFRAMNPENGWGSYDTLLKTLREMRAAVPEAPCEWRASG